MIALNNFLIFGSLFLLLSCDVVDSKEVKENSISVNTFNEVLELNKGERWRVNKQMMPFIKFSEELLIGFRKANDTNYKKLAAALKECNNKLIASCTMEGKSHDALHQWLHPHLNLVKALENSTSASEVTANIEKLNHSFQIFNTFFE
jgi:hypothetical protein